MRPGFAIALGAFLVLTPRLAVAAPGDTPITAPLPADIKLPDAGPVTVPPADIKRDPFRPFMLDIKPVRSGAPKTPLEEYDIGALKLVAVIWSAANPRAMVENATGLGFTIQVGTKIGPNGGVVRKIEPNQVVVEEEFVDFYNEKKKTEIVLKLQTEGEKKP
ncbi:MAG: pilus assembly protein PilP [Candidatus Binatia bacterium]